MLMIVSTFMCRVSCMCHAMFTVSAKVSRPTHGSCTWNCCPVHGRMTARCCVNADEKTLVSGT